MNVLKDQDIAQLIEFVFLRYKDDGGFAAFPSLPSTIEDTFYAVDMLKKLHYLAPDVNPVSRISPDKIRDFIRAHATGQAPLTARLRYYLDRIGSICNLPPHSTCGVDFGHEKIISFADRYYLAALKSAAPAAADIPPPDLDHCTCKDVYYYVLLRPKADQAQGKTLVNWLQRCQNYDGGFGFYPGTTSFIENCDYCLTALAVLGERPLDTASARRFIFACQCAAGGFSRNIKAVPFLESTWHAVNIFNLRNS
jgi:hypothetical protein